MNHPSLSRHLTFLPLFCIVVAGIIGAGIFTTSGLIIRDIGSPYLMLLAWVLGGFFALCGALCYAELGALFPRAGGDYVFLRESFGKGAAFLSGWVSLIVGFSAPIAAVAVAFALYLSSAVPGGVPDSGIKAIAVAIIVVMSFVHYRGLSFGARIQTALTIGKIAIILSMIIGGLVWGNGSFEHFKDKPSPDSSFFLNFATALIFISFAYSGWNASAYLGGEIREPERNLPRSLIYGTLCVIVIYLLLNIVFVYGVSPAEMAGVEEVGSLAALHLFGPAAGAVYSLAIALCLVSTLGAMVVTGPRIYYAMASDGVFFEMFGRVHPTRRVPDQAIILQSAIAVLLVLTSTFQSLLLYIGVVLSVFSTLTVLSMMFLRTKRPQLVRPYKTLGYPVTPVIFIIGNLWIVVFCLRSNPMTALWSSLTILAGLACYCYFRYRQPYSSGDRPAGRSDAGTV